MCWITRVILALNSTYDARVKLENWKRVPSLKYSAGGAEAVEGCVFFRVSGDYILILKRGDGASLLKNKRLPEGS